jgi:hypothetical protein
MEEDGKQAVPDADCVAYSRALAASGRLVAAASLQAVATATTLRVRAGRVTMTDGPFAETKEALAGFYLIEAANLDEALQVAAEIPPARAGSIEVRPVRALAGA